MTGRRTDGVAGGGAADRSDLAQLLADAAAHRDAGRIDAAERLCREAVALAPDQPAPHAALGHALRARGTIEEAAACYRRAAALEPGGAALNNIGVALHELARFEDAAAIYRRALALRPGHAGTLTNLGNALARLGRDGEAQMAYRDALLADPTFPEAWINLGNLYKDAAQHADAVECYRRAIAVRPDHAAAHEYLGVCLLLTGDLEAGWKEYEWRRAVARRRGRLDQQALPQWQGTPHDDGAVLLWGEQGIGDEILYAGLAAEAAARAGRCVLECDPRLVPLFARSFRGVEVVARSDPPHPRTRADDVVAQCATGSLGRWFRDGVPAFPPRRGYLRPDEPRRHALRSAYGQDGRMIVGISWLSRNLRFGQHRTIALERWSPILTERGMTFVNLQYGDCAAEIEALGDALGIAIHRDPAIDPLRDLDGFASQVAAMDLVISADNSTVHMAGALGVPVWTLLPAGPGLVWYWFLDRDDSPWYPSMRLFRQATPGEWAPVIERVAEALRQRTRSP